MMGGVVVLCRKLEWTGEMDRAYLFRNVLEAGQSLHRDDLLVQDVERLHDSCL